MTDLPNMSMWMALSAGFLSFISPCVLPIIPSYMGFITGMSFEDLTQNQNQAAIRRATIINSLLFILGFSTIFIILGATATAFGSALNKYQHIMRLVGGAIVVILGVHFTGLVNIKFLQVEKRIHLRNRPLGYLGSLLIGFAFGAGWTPCIGPILGSILMVAATQTEVTKGISLLGMYSIGFGVPFFLSAIALNKFLTTYRRVSRHIPKFVIASGIILIIVGILIMTNNLSFLGLIMTDWISG
ncbi:cytochrome C biogenesis protein [bacterium F11]|nr:cytochrome C biogenesis protein [bacterium F11]